MTLEQVRYARGLVAANEPVWERLPHQHPPTGDWFGWIMEAGRGSGKSFAANMATRDHLNGPPCISSSLPHRAAIIAPTLGDAVETAETDDGSLLRMQPDALIRTIRGGTTVIWPNKSQVRLFGVHTHDDVERLRAGGNRCWVHAEEFAAWRYLTDGWDQMMFGLRLGPQPRWVISTTPKARPEYLAIVETLEKRDDVTVTGASTDDNPHLSATAREYLYGEYDGTALGEQELHGKRVEEAEGALWDYQLIDGDRLPAIDPATLGRIVVAVDPPGGKTEAGIVTTALIPACDCRNDAPLPHFAVLADVSGKLSPNGWGSRAIDQYHEWGADRIVGEANYGGDMVEATIANIDDDAAYKPVHASRGKRIRAEPIKALYEKRRVHHVGTLQALEAEMVQWVPDESPWSPNRLDALVWGITELMGHKPKPDLSGWVVDPDLMKPRGI